MLHECGADAAPLLLWLYRHHGHVAVAQPVGDATRKPDNPTVFDCHNYALTSLK
jgi:hypothetical protein